MIQPSSLIGGSELIRVGVVRDPAFSAPVPGSWYGEATANEGMTAGLQVSRRKMERQA